jgi:hypothetical protein
MFQLRGPDLPHSSHEVTSVTRQSFELVHCHALTLEILIILYVWLGQGVTRVGNSMFSISLFLAECSSPSEAAVYRNL